MIKYGKNFWLIFLPFHMLAAASIFWVTDYWLWLLAMWFMIGVVGNGVAAHRYFAHGQFECATPIRWILGVLATLGAIGPLNYWAIQHKVHHAFSDTDADPHTPVGHSWWYVFYSWTFPQGSNQEFYLRHRFAKRIALQQAKDPFFVFFARYHYVIIYSFCVLLAAFDPALVLIYALAYCIDFLRLGLINYYCHKGGYRNHDTKDSSTNNMLLGLLGMGFGWHNNHHASPGKLVLTERWWEIDVEGYIGWLLSLTAKTEITK